MTSDPGGPRVAPTLDDPVVARSSVVLGGPLGGHAGPATGRAAWWTPVRVLLALACLVYGLGLLADSACRTGAWPEREGRTVWVGMCYSDLPYLYRERGLADGRVPYLDSGAYPALEYPVLTGALFGGAAAVARASLPLGAEDDPNRGALRFYDVLALALWACALVLVVATARTVPRRPWDAALVAASPVLLLTATINADLLPAALVALAVLAWTRERPLLTGVLLGLGTAAKLYPLLLLGPIAVLCVRERRWRDLGLVVGGAAAAWLAIDLPVWLAAREAWLSFWRFNADRAADFGSPWYALSISGMGIDPGRLDVVALLLLVAACSAVAALGLLAPEPPRLAQLAFLVVAAFCLVNKVWSPQYALWLLPLAALARPRWRDLLVWQAGEVVHFVTVWLYLDALYSPDTALVTTRTYALVVALRAACLLWLVGVVVRDVVRPEHDPVRQWSGPVRPAAEPA